jgi:hypothetical protein
MARFGRCKNCWWWNKIGKDKGNCLFNATKEDDDIIGPEGYCQDYYSRTKGNKEFGETLQEWCKKHGFKYIIYRELYD